jgi:hypothetical protein
MSDEDDDLNDMNPLELLAEMQRIYQPVMRDRQNELFPICNTLNIDFNVMLTVTCTACPLQIEGSAANGNYIYFRSRWDNWEFHVVATKDNLYTGSDLFAMDGVAETGGSWMEPSEAHAILVDCLTQYAAPSAPGGDDA